MERWINYMTDHSSEPGHSTNWECWKHLRGRDQSSCCTHPWQQGWTLFPIRVWQNHSATRGEDEYCSLEEPRKGKTQRWKRVQTTLDGSREGEGCGVSERAHFLPRDSWADRGVDRMARGGKHFRAPEKEEGNKSHHPEGHNGAPVTSAAAHPQRRIPPFPRICIQHPIHTRISRETRGELDILPLTRMWKPFTVGETPVTWWLRALEHPRMVET